MPRTTPPRFRKNLLALAAIAALTPSVTWALDLVQSPPLPTSKSAYAAPNVIISVDDSGSMDFRLDQENATGATNQTTPVAGVWPSTSKRMNVLKHSLTQIFSDKDLIPDGKIRLAWQVMHANGNNTVEKSVDSATLQTNSMRSLKGGVAEAGTHRTNFLSFVSKLKPNNGTPSHTMFSQADAYMRRALSSSGPWSTDPGGTGSKSTEYLGCRRNYHIMMTDGRWSGPASGANEDGKKWDAEGNREAYSLTSDQTQIYRDTEEKTLADWAFISWMKPLQISGLKDAEKLQTSKIYKEALATELFSKTRNKFKIVTATGSNNTQRKNACNNMTGEWLGGSTNNCKVQDGTETKSVNLQKYWNPKYNPATWPHMVTYTIGFSNAAIEWPGAPNIEVPSIAPYISETEEGGYLDFDDKKGFVDLVTGLEKWPSMNVTKNGNEDEGEEVRSLDLWHAAINGRGRFYPVTKGEDLEKAFRAIIGKINEDSTALPEKISPGGTTSGYNTSQNNAGLFGSIYNAKLGWSGNITATPAREPEEYACPTKEDPEAKCIRFPNPIAEWGGKTTAEHLDERSSVDDRLILSWSDKWAGTKPTGGVAFQWATDDSKLSTAQKALLGVATDATGATVATRGENVLNFIRGDRSLEAAAPTTPPTAPDPNKPFRTRTSRQGDIVNSEIWYTGSPISRTTLSGYSAFISTYKNREPMLYVGGNDGMLHGFSAKNGTEKLAYVPRGVIADLKKLADTDYEHRYYVDGSPMTGDVQDSSAWKTMLVATLGAGGKGYFVLDVTNPAGFASASASTLITLDRTRGNSEAEPVCTSLTGTEKTACTAAAPENADIGNIVAQPVRNPSDPQETTQITRMNNGRWAAVMGNGYNSANQRPVLLVQYLDGDKELKRIQTTAQVTGVGNAKDNGLAAPALVDLDGDGKTDVAYAGDNLGNLWKFDLTSDTDSTWAVAFGGIDNNNPGSGKPLFTTLGLVAIDSTTRTEVQPITAPPIVRANDRNMIVDGKIKAVGGMTVAFGTGRNLTSSDRRTDITQNVQTLYSVLDNTRYRKKSGKTHLEVHPGTGDCATKSDCVPTPAAVGMLTSAGSPLAKQSIAAISALAGFETVNATQELKKETWKDYKGWYLDLPGKGERLLSPMQFWDGSNILAVYTAAPDGTKSSSSDNINESCVDVKIDTSAGSQYRTLINIMDGKVPSIPLVDANGDNVFDSKDKSAARMSVNTGSPLLITTTKNIMDYTGVGADTTKAIKGARMPEQSMRPSWRQLK